MKFVEKPFRSIIELTGIVNLHFFEFPENFYTENDSHPFYELVFVVSGKLYINSDEYNGVLEKNHMILHTPNENHSLSCDTGYAPTVIIIGFNCKGDLINRFSKSPVLLSDAEIKTLSEIIKEGRNVFSRPYNVPTYDMKKKRKIPIGSEQILKIMLEYFFIKIIKNNSAFQDSPADVINYKINVDEIINYLEENFREKVTLDELSFIFGTNRATLCREFKNTTGKTVNEFILDKKLSYAEKMIKETSLTFTEIAEKSGFADIHYFTNVFKRQTGLTPSVFKNLNK